MADHMGETSALSISGGVGKFVVCIHDVSASSIAILPPILAAIKPVRICDLSIAIIPQPDEAPADAASHSRMHSCAAAAGEVLIHGLTHRRVPSGGLFSRLTGCSDEFANLTEAQTLDRVAQARQIFQSQFGINPRGFLPPAWCAGRVIQVMQQAGIEYLIKMRRLLRADGSGQRLATWSWDAGVIPWLGHGLHAWGSWSALDRSAVPVVAIHPIDVRRGFLSKAAALIARFLKQGRRPTTFAALCGAASVERVAEHIQGSET